MKEKLKIEDLLKNYGVETLNSMQEAALDSIINQNDVLLVSPTGSGKTLGFLLPLSQLLKPNVAFVQCLLLTPSRELAIQIEQVWKKLGTGLKVNTCFGGHSMQVEIQNLTNPPALLIGTPGRIADHLTRRSFDTSGITTIILDEFDKSLDMGFQDQMDFVFGHLRNLKKRVLVSATAGIKIPEFVNFNQPTILNFSPTREENNEKLDLRLVISNEKDRIDTLIDLICTFNSESAIIFCNHRDAVERTSSFLTERGIVNAFYHGGLEQDDRERALIQFRNGSVNYLVTTDLAARGLDIPEMKHVVHYHLPLHEHEFTHRNGRTARMEAKGTAYLITFKEDVLPVYLRDEIEELFVPKNQNLPELPLFSTIYISGGKKNKLNKFDIVGFFLQKGNLEKEDLGLIEVKDFSSFAAIKKTKVKGFLLQIKEEKMKGKKYKIEVAR